MPPIARNARFHGSWRSGKGQSADANAFDTCPFLTYRAPMPATLETLAQDALVLPPDQRLTLACQLLASVEPDPEPGADAAWETEIVQRIARFDAGESTIPAATVFASLRQIAPER